LQCFVDEFIKLNGKLIAVNEKPFLFVNELDPKNIGNLAILGSLSGADSS